MDQPPQYVLLLAMAGAALASPAGGFVTLWVRPSTLFLSCVLGFASGVLMGAIAFEMLPSAFEHAGLALAVAGFGAGLAAIYALDLFVHRGFLVGEASEQRLRLRGGRRARGDEITVLAGGTSIEELVEGLTIGVALAVEPELGLLVALAVGIDNLAEGLSIGELIRNAKNGDGRRAAWRIILWTSTIALALIVSSLVGWFLLRDLPGGMLGLLFGVSAGGIFYLTVTDLVPEAEKHQFQQAPAIAMGAGLMLMFALSSFGR
ncbi:MAG TPA: ZIP family metal transporter [Vitreimonas sp.]|uniref:ZIP family metal transporter n=1 Tax=Vitreimonas sp. TaxID=3069702 RepID=UPI002D652607|nr:ZIP family metal transporter [Vitreimonas sp.]HYD86168.1 ZIP family metal transporter [Vitreimonas sp.]